MQPYANFHGNSGIVEYEISEESITVMFKHGKRTYTYNNSLTGEEHVNIMKSLAEEGLGLSKYIAQHRDMLFE